MNSQKSKIISMGLAILALSACSSVHKTGDQETTSVSKESRQVAVQESASYVTDLSFDEGSAKLSSSDRSKLDEIISKAKYGGRIDDVKVISWSDAEYPSLKKGKLSKAQGSLAERRAENIKNYLKGLDRSLDIDTFNMAEQPGSLSKLFKTENSKIKKSLETAGIAHDDGDDRYSAKAGKSTVMVILKE